MPGRLRARVGRQSCASWSLGPLRGELADEQEKAFAAAGTDPRIVRRFRVGRWIGGVRADLAARLHRLPVEKKQQTSAGGFFALGGMPEAEVADFMQTLGQDVLEEAAHELLARDAAHPPANSAMPSGLASLKTPMRASPKLRVRGPMRGRYLRIASLAVSTKPRGWNATTRSSWPATRPNSAGRSMHGQRCTLR